MRRREATANKSNSPKVHLREIQLATVQIKPVVFTLPRCTSSELFFSCCESVAALPVLANFNERVAKTNISRQHPPTPLFDEGLLHHTRTVAFKMKPFISP
jgi:hypothetical protein